MDAVEKRVQDRIAQERRQLQAEQMELGKRAQRLVKDSLKPRGAVDKLLSTLADGAVPTKAVSEAGTTALKALGKFARDMLSVNERMAKNAAELAKLDSPKERERRVKDARDLGVDDRPMTGLEAAELVLVHRGRAAHVTDITKDVLQAGVVRLTGKTPEQTMSAYLAKAIGRPETKFVRVGAGVYDLTPEYRASLKPSAAAADGKSKRKAKPTADEIVPVA